MEFPSSSALHDILAQLRTTTAEMSKTQERLMSLNGVARSDDRMVRVVVGPRGQLVDLEIDPRVFRKPDARKLTAVILATAAAAVQDISEQVREIVDAQVPPEVDELREQFGSPRDDPIAELWRPDADVYAERKLTHG